MLKILKTSKEVVGIMKRREIGRRIILVILTILLLSIILWFFLSCYAWMVAAFPTFNVFPRWAFILLLFLMTVGKS